MKNTILLAAVLISPFFFTGCETTVVERRPGYRRPIAYQEGYYADDRSRNPYRRDEYRDEVRVVRSNDGSYYRPTPVVRENVVIVNRRNTGRGKKKVVVTRKKKHRNNDRDYDRKHDRDDN